MRKSLLTVCLVYLLLFAVSAIAADRVVVIPLNSCSDGLTQCSGKYVDTDHDPRNCGACGTDCGTEAYCVNGGCKTLSSYTCTQNTDCITGICSDEICRVGRTIFVTSTITKGNFGGVEAADAICNNLANQAGLTGYYMAWVSELDNQTAPVNRFTYKSIVPYYRVDGVIIAANWTELISGTLQERINVDELKRTDIRDKVWTNVKYIGTCYATDIQNTCNEWQSESSEIGPVGTGDTTYASSAWSMETLTDCDEWGRIYCFQQ